MSQVKVNIDSYRIKIEICIICYFKVTFMHKKDITNKLTTILESLNHVHLPKDRAIDMENALIVSIENNTQGGVLAHL